MPIFGQSKVEDVGALVAKKNYARAIEVLRDQLRSKRDDPRVRMQLVDVLVAAGKGREAVPLLVGIADDYAREGFIPKAISVLKRIQKIDPTRRDVETRLASLIEEKQKSVAVPSVAPGGPSFEIGIEEIDMGSAPISVAAAVEEPSPAFEPLREEPPAPEPPAIELSFAPEPAPPVAAEPEPLEIGVAAPAEPEPVIEVATPVAPARAARPPQPVLVEDNDLFVASDELQLVSGEPEAVPVVMPEAVPLEVPLAAVETPALDLAAGEEFSLDTEEFSLDQPAEEPAEGGELLLEAEGEAEPGPAMTDAAFGDELVSLVDEMFQDLRADASTGSSGSFPGIVPTGGTQIVVSPLFKDFSVDEMVAVIQGLNLQTYRRGDVVIREGQPGNSLFMTAAGSLRVFRKDASGKQVPLGDLREGSFFGEMSVLSGKPRTASVVALSECELLELDRPTLDGIVAQHPHVWQVMQEFAAQRKAGRA
jgi:hypothetical protein